MKRFTQLFHDLDGSNATNDKIAALVSYLGDAQPADAAWAVYLLAGGKPRQVVPTAVLRETARRLAGIEDWLFDAAYQHTGDLAETIANILPPPTEPDDTPLAVWMTDRLLPLRGRPPAEQADAVAGWWNGLDREGRFLLTKLIGGGFRVGVSKLMVQRALARHGGLPETAIAQRLMGYTDARRRPEAEDLLALLAAEDGARRDPGQPYPFCLAHPLEPGRDPADGTLGPRADWAAEWKYDGIRCQLVRRAQQVWLWSRGEELITERFPEVVAAVHGLPDGVVIDGELLVWREGRPAPFAELQPRITRKTVGRKLLAETPVRLLAYDLLEHGGADLRARPLSERRYLLEQLQAAHPNAFEMSPWLRGDDWPALAAARADSRDGGVEGLMLKPLGSPYGVGRSKTGGGWWKWKVDPLTCDAVLIYAQAGHGRRSGLYTDYSFAVWNRPPSSADEAQAVVEAIRRREPAQPGALQLLPVAKAYSGLTDEEFKRVDREIRAHTLEKFGPVRSVVPTMVFELGFEGLQRSGRHKSGIAVRFPRMLRIRDDKPLHEADTLQSLEALLPG